MMMMLNIYKDKCKFVFIIKIILKGRKKKTRKESSSKIQNAQNKMIRIMLTGLKSNFSQEMKKKSFAIVFWILATPILIE
jgi:hypothetical protein